MVFLRVVEEIGTQVHAQIGADMVAAVTDNSGGETEETEQCQSLKAFVFRRNSIYRQAGCSVRELVLMGRAAHMPFWGAASKTDEKQVDFALEATGMQALQRRLISELSSGEMQRAQIAMALAQDAPIIMLDEPTAFLDLRHQLETLTLLRELNCEHGRSILCVSHDLNLLSRFFKMLFVLESGKIYTQGNVSEVLTSRTLLDVFGVEAGIERDSAGCVRIDMTIK